MALPLSRLTGHRIALDTNVLIYFLANHATYLPLVRPLFKAIESGAIEAVASVITEAEIRTQPTAQHDERTLAALDEFFADYPHLVIWPVTRTIARRAAEVRAVSRLRMPDALIIATSQDAECLALVGNDREWRGKTQPCEFLYLTELLDASGSV